MSGAGDSTSAALIAQSQRETEGLRETIAALTTENAALRAEVETLRAAAAKPAMAAQRNVLLVALSHNGQTFPPGALLPFDPANPPAGCNGLRAGVHYHLAPVVEVERAPSKK